MFFLKNIILAIIHFVIGDWRYFLIGASHGRKEVVKHHYAITGNGVKDSSVIFMANGYSWHGGLCDRLKGIVFTYKWCKDHNRRFYIKFNHPFELERYFKHNIYNWQIDDKDIHYNTEDADVCYIMYDTSISKYEKDGSLFRRIEQYLNKAILGKNKQIHVYTNAYIESKKEFCELFSELFKPSVLVEKHLQKHLQILGNEYISISFRFVQLLGDFKDTSGEVLDDIQSQNLIEHSLKVIEQLHEDYPQYLKIFVTADSHTFTDIAKKFDYVYVADGKVGHIDFENSDEVNIKTFVDFLLIAKAEKVFLAKSHKMYNSAFAKIASWSTNKPFERIDF